MALVPTLLAAPVASRPLAASIADALGVAQSGGAMTSLTDAARVTDAREEEKQARARALLASATLRAGGVRGAAWSLSKFNYGPVRHF